MGLRDSMRTSLVLSKKANELEDLQSLRFNRLLKLSLTLELYFRKNYRNIIHAESDKTVIYTQS